MTDGMTRFDGLHAGSLLPGVQSFVSVGCFSLSGVQIASRASASSSGIRFTSAAIRSSALRRRRSSRSGSTRPLSRSSRDHLVGVLARAPRPARARARSTSASVDRRARACRRPPRARARARPSARLVAERAATSSSAELAGHRQVGLERDAARLDLAGEPVQQLARARLDERAATARPSTRATSASATAARNCGLGLLLDLLAQARLDVGAQLGERVELARGARELVVERRQHLLLDLLDASPSTVCVESSASSKSISFVSPALMPTTPCSISSTRRPAPSSTT